MTKIVFRLIWILAGTIVFAFILLIIGKIDVNGLKQLMSFILTPLIILVGFSVCFYLSSKTNNG